MYAKKEKMFPAYVSKHNSNREKQLILLMIVNGERLHNLVLKKTISIIKRNNLKSPRLFLLSELPSFFCNRKKSAFYKKVCENKDFCNVLMPSEDTEVLKFNQYKKSDKAPFIIYVDLECLTLIKVGFLRIGFVVGD